jgi:hypothetical protein
VARAAPPLIDATPIPGMLLWRTGVIGELALVAPSYLFSNDRRKMDPCRRLPTALRQKIAAATPPLRHILLANRPVVESKVLVGGGAAKKVFRVEISFPASNSAQSGTYYFAYFEVSENAAMEHAQIERLNGDFFLLNVTKENAASRINSNVVASYGLS